MKDVLPLEQQPNSDKMLIDIPSAQMPQNPMLVAVLNRRDYPCICCSCPQCDAVFMASALKAEYHNDNDANKELLNDLAKYASQGYNISVKNSDEFKLDYCSHLKNK